MAIARVNPAPLLGMTGPRPSLWAVHGALILAQVMFGGGAVVGRLGVESFNPLLFALIRDFRLVEQMIYDDSCFFLLPRPL